MSTTISTDPDLATAFAIAFGIATAVVHLAFAAGVYAEAAKTRARGERILFAPPSIWMLATVLAGPFTAAAFWFVHFSPRRPRDQRDLVDDTGGAS